jgi:hypothetical protein
MEFKCVQTKESTGWGRETLVSRGGTPQTEGFASADKCNAVEHETPVGCTSEIEISDFVIEPVLSGCTSEI